MTISSETINVCDHYTSDSVGTSSTVPIINLPILQGPITSITNAISSGTFIGSSGLAARTAAVSATASTHYYSSINTYDFQTMNPDTKDRKYQWVVITRNIYGWTICTVNVKNADVLMDLFCDRQVQFGLDPIMNIPLNVTVFALYCRFESLDCGSPRLQRPPKGYPCDKSWSRASLFGMVLVTKFKFWPSPRTC